MPHSFRVRGSRALRGSGARGAHLPFQRAPSAVRSRSVCQPCKVDGDHRQQFGSKSAASHYCRRRHLLCFPSFSVEKKKTTSYAWLFALLETMNIHTPLSWAPCKKANACFPRNQAPWRNAASRRGWLGAKVAADPEICWASSCKSPCLLSGWRSRRREPCELPG